MGESLRKQLEQLIRDRKQHQRWLALFLCLALLFGLGTTAALSVTGQAMIYKDRALTCPVESGTVAHTHNADCYDADGVLVCPLEELPAHVHDDSCYTAVSLLACGLEENPSHEHTEDCYDETSELICGMTEGEGSHTHTDACYTETVELTCDRLELPVHVHGEGCFTEIEQTAEETTAPEESAAPTESPAPSAEPEESDEELEEQVDIDRSILRIPAEADGEADLEDAAFWEELFRGFEMSGNWATDVLAVAESQLGVGESKANYAVNAQGERKGITRFGQWYGIPYGDWCAMFVSFCLSYAGVPDMPIDCSCQNWIKSLVERDMYGAAAWYTPKAGDIVFFDFDQDDFADHVGLVSAIDFEANTLTTIEGNRTDVVERFVLDRNDASIMGYGALPVNPNPVPYVYGEDQAVAEEPVEETPAEPETVAEPETESDTAIEDNTTETPETVAMPAVHFEDTAATVTVVVDAPEGAFPAGTEMKVSAVSAGKVVPAASEVIDGQIVGVEAVDISFYYNNEEIQPALPIRVSLSSRQLAQQEESHLLHLSDSGDVQVLSDAESVDGGLSFDAPSFSVYALVYTVDFSYSVDDEIYQFSLSGGEKVALSDLIELLGIIRGTNYESVEAFIAHVSDVKFSDENLVKVTHKTPTLGIFGKEDWVLESINPFDTVEYLTLAMDNGDVISIRVTDDQVTITSDLKPIASIKSIDGAVDNGDGTYTVVAGETYTIKMHFEETDSIQANMDGSVTYQLPDGFNFTGSKSGKIELEVSAGHYAEATYTVSDNGLITFTWDTSDPDYDALKASGYMTFDFDLTGQFDGSSAELSFTSTTTGTVNVETGGHLDISKSGSYNAETNQVEYTVTVTGTGVNNNVVVQDTISGDALTFNSITEITSNKKGTVTPSSQSINSKGFSMTFGNVANGETIAIKYTADVDLSKLAGATDEQKLTFTKNTVQTTSDHQTDPKTAESNLQYNIGISDVSKQAVEKGEVGSDGKQTISWEINANRNANISMNGQSITDTIRADSRDRLHYSGDGIYVTKRDKAGNVVGTERQLVTWAELGITDPSSAFTWTYSPTDTTPYWYQIDYETVADSSGLISNKNLNNDVDGGYGSHSGGQTTVGPLGGGIGLKKQAVKTDLANKEVTWEITVNVPKEGLDSCVVRDILPAYIIDNSTTPYVFAGKDSLVSVSVTSGLEEGESFTQETGTFEDGRSYVELTFHKTNSDGTTSDGLSSSSATRKVRIHVVTKLDNDFLKYAEEHPDDYNARIHTNNVEMWANSEVFSDQASVQIDESSPSISKSHADIEKSDGGPETVMVKYYVTLTGVNDSTKFPIVLTDTFNSKYFSFQDLNDTNFNSSNGYLYGTDINTPKGGTKGSSRVVEETTPGTLTITLNKDDLPKNGSDYYPLYVVQYYLKVKDAATLIRLNNDAVQQPNGTVTFVNRVTSDDFGTATDTVDYQVPMLTKDLLKNTKIELDATTGMYKGTFEIDVNPDAKTIGDEATLTLKDTTKNLSIVYDTIRVYEADGTTVCSDAEWNRSGYSIVYTLPNSRHLKIRYDVIVTGSGEVKWENSAELNGQEITKTGTQDMSAAGNGSGYSYKIDILKHDKDDLTKTLPGAKFTLYRWTGSQEYTGQDMLAYSDLTKYGHLWDIIRSDLVTESNGIAGLDHETEGEGGHLRRDTWYMLVETESPEGYDKASYNPIFKIAKDGQADYSNYTYVNGDTLAIRNSQTPPTKANITATKVWTGDSDDTSLRKPVTLHLYADGVPYADYKDSDKRPLASRTDTDVTLSDDNNWSYTWSNLPGGPTYTVKEDAVPGYVTSYSPTYGLVNDGTITVTNAKRQNKTAIHVEKEWNGTPTADVTLQLKRNVVPNATISIYGQNKRVFVSADNFAVGDKVHLEFNASENGFISGYKIYNARSNEVLVENKKTENAEDKYVLHQSQDFTVPSDGIIIVIDDVDGDINSWNANWAFGEKKPTVALSSKGEGATAIEDSVYTLENHTVTLNADNNWQADIDNLALSDEDGSYTYFVTETGVNDNDRTPEEAGYTVTYDNNDGITKGTIKVTNSKEEPNKTTITLNKNWSGNNHGGNTEVSYEIYRTTTQPTYHTVTLTYPEEVDNDTGHTDISTTKTKTYQVLDGSDVELFVTHAWWDPYPSELYDVKVNGEVKHFDAQHSSSREITLYSWVKYEEHIFTIDNITADTTIELDYKNLNAEEFMEPVLEERPQHTLGEPYKTGTISGGGNNWTTTITDLDKTDEDGHPYYYFIYETDLDMDDTTDLTRFDTSYSHQYVDATSDDRTVTITNTIRPEYTWLQVHKVWENVETTPDSVDVVLYRRLKTETGKPHWYDQIKIVPEGLKEAVDATKWNQDLHETWSAGWYALSPDYDYFIAETNVNGEWYSNANYFINYTDASGNAITPETYEGDNNRYYPVQTGAVSGYHHATITNSNTQVNFEKKWAGAVEGKFTIDGVAYTQDDFVIEVQLKQYINGSSTAADPMKASDQYNASQTMTLDGAADSNPTGKYYENEPWHFVWKGLPAIGMDTSGNREDYTYKVVETGVYLKGTDGKKTGDNLLDTGIFRQTTSADGKTITNTFVEAEVPTTDVTVKKAWSNKDGSDRWPAGLEVEMTLYKVPVTDSSDDGEDGTSAGEIVTGSGITNPVTLSATQPQYKWENLPELDETSFKYVVKEEVLVGYTTYAIQADGSSVASDTAAVVEGEASFTNKENDNGKVAIQVTKNIKGSNDEKIDLFNDVTNRFTIKTKSDDSPASVVGAHKGEHDAADTKNYAAGYTETTEKPSTFDITVSGAEAGEILISNRTPGMYTITEDKASIPDQIIDKYGKVWTYKETQILTEYAWRSNEDGSGYHYSDKFTKESGDYTAIPEIAGSYGEDLYNGRLDFVVNNIYESTDENVEVETLNIQLNKAWDRGGDATPPESGSVTFELHQVATTTITETGDDGDGDNESKEITLRVGKKPSWGSASILHEYAVERGTTVNVSYSYSDNYSNNGGNKAYTINGGASQPLNSGSGIISVPIPNSGIAELILSDDWGGSDLNSATLPGYEDLLGKGDIGSGSSGNTTTLPSVTDPDGSGFPKTITLTAAEDGDVWKHLEKDLLSKTVSTDGNTTKTTTYKYYLVETGRTGLASAYTSLSFDGMGSESNPISASEKNTTVTVSATNSVPKPDEKFITMHKQWLDQDGNPMTNHPDEVLVDVYRVKLPSGVGAAGGVSFVTEGDIYGVVGSRDTWKDNNNTVKNKVIFEANGQYYYVRSNAQTNLSYNDLEEYVGQVQRGEKVRGDWVTSIRPSPVYTPEDLFNDGQGLYIQRGSLCLYNGKYYVFLDTGDSYGGIEKSNGGPGREGGWEEVAAGKVIANLNITPPDNELLISKESIESTYIPALRTKINEQLQKYNMTWSEEDSKLVRYQVNGKDVTIPISEVDNWATSFTAEAGYLYFFFEQPVPGFTTLYGNEEHGVFSQTQAVVIQNQTTVGSLEVSKNWTVEEGEKVPASVIYAKVYRDNIDITDELAADAAKYGLKDGDFYPSAGHYYLKVPVNGAKTLQGLPIAANEQNAKAYQYVVQERGYGSGNTADYENDVWDVSDVFENYTTKYSQRENTGTTEDEPNYEFVEKSVTESTGSASAATPVGAVTTVTTTNSETGEKESNIVFTAGKGEVTINNATESLGSVKVTKTFSGIAELPSTFKITVSYSDNVTADRPTELKPSDTDVEKTGTGTEADPYVYTWTISDLPKGTVVTFKESGYEETGYTVTTSPDKDSNGDVKAEATAAKTPGEAAFVNTYEQAATLDVKIIKVDANTTTRHLTGAKFELYRYDAVGDPAYTDKRDEAEVNTDGELTFEGLTEGYYKLVETKTPDGYVKTTSDPWFHVKRETDGTLSVEVVDGSESVLSYSETDKAILVKNTPGVALPSAGGAGTLAYLPGGLGLFLGAALLLLLRRRRRGGEA